MLRYAEWRAVIAEYIAKRRGLDPTNLLPRVVGQVSLALALSAYEQGLESASGALANVLDGSMAHLSEYLLG